jgi:thiamine-monophosphate kinase
LNERELIALFHDVRGEPIAVPNGDDAAGWQTTPGLLSLATTDALVEGVHFDLVTADPMLLGRKLLSVNLSDIAAMGGQPRYGLLSFSIPKTWRDAQWKALASGVMSCARDYGVAIVGGNLSAARQDAVLSATVIGEVSPKEVLRRRGCRVGDALFVTGTLGDARAGLALSRVESEVIDFEVLLRRFHDPEPRVSAGRALARSGWVRAMCDVSDGLAQDVRNLLEADGFGAEVDAMALPLSAELARFHGGDLRHAASEALLGGEDYELLFAGPSERCADLVALGRTVGVPVTRIGTVIEPKLFRVVDQHGAVTPLGEGYQHF